MIAALRAVPDLDAELFVAEPGKPALDALLTTHGERININTALEQVLDAVFSDRNVTAQVVNQRQSAPFRSDSEISEFLNKLRVGRAVKRTPSLLDVKSVVFTVRITPADEVGAEALTALVRRTDGGVQALYVQRRPKEVSP